MKFRFCPPGSLVLGLLFGLMAGQLSAQSLPRLLEAIKVSEVNGQETVRFSFSEPYAGVPLEEHASGRMSLGFSGTGSSTPVRSFRVRDSKIFQDIRVVQNKYSTTVSFTLKDASTTLKGRLGFARDKNALSMSVAPAATGRAPPGPNPSPDENLLSQMSKTIAGAPSTTKPLRGDDPLIAPPTAPERAAQPLGLYEGVGWLGTMAMLGISLAGIVGGLYLVLYLYRRLFAARLGNTVSGYPIKMLSSFHIGPKQRVIVLDINGEIVACGVTTSQISLIARLGGSQSQRRPQPGRPNRPAPASEATGQAAGQATGQTRATTAGAAAQPATQQKSAKPDPVQQFAEALKDKVGSMKRIK